MREHNGDGCITRSHTSQKLPRATSHRVAGSELSCELLVPGKLTLRHGGATPLDGGVEVRVRHRRRAQRLRRHLEQRQLLGAALARLAWRPAAVGELAEVCRALQLAQRRHQRVADQHRQVCAGESGGAPREGAQLLLAQAVGRAAEVQLEQSEPRLLVGQRDVHPPLEPPPHGWVKLLGEATSARLAEVQEVRRGSPRFAEAKRGLVPPGRGEPLPHPP
mmetsp:Transcript_33431/g.104978  ORF Transcript_33431/g.104978 Transcript_33431/m.104978 type:complete len:220 (-) Transcript_33431:8-667(-)